MKKYLLIGGYKDLSVKDEITREDLGGLKTRDYDWIIDTGDGTYFDAKKNEWREITEKGIEIELEL